MNQGNFFSIKSSIELKFNGAPTRDIAYNSFLPGQERLNTKRSQVEMVKKEEESLLFQVESTDITAFRASVSDIIGFGKIIENTLKLCE